MDTPELTHALKHAAATVLGLTAVGAIAALIAPGLAGNTRPHPTLTGSVTDALSILANNLRVLAVPFLVWLLRFAGSRVGRLLGDLAVGAMVALSTITVGIALGRWRTRLIPYLPHLPLEWAALTVAVATWLVIRTAHAHAHQLIALGSTVAVLLCAAAALETWATPHRHTSSPVRHASGLPPMGAGRVDRAARLCRRGPVRADRLSVFDSRRGARAPTDRRHINHRPPWRDHRLMNSVSITGNLTQAPQLRQTSSDISVAQMRVAVSRPRKNGEDQGADYVDVTVFGVQAENCVKYLAKGRKIGVKGHLHHSEWQSDTGRRQKLVVTAEEVEFLSPPDRTPHVGQPEPVAVGVATDTEGDGEDIPF